MLTESAIDHTLAVTEEVNQILAHLIPALSIIMRMLKTHSRNSYQFSNPDDLHHIHLQSLQISSIFLINLPLEPLASAFQQEKKLLFDELEVFISELLDGEQVVVVETLGEVDGRVGQSEQTVVGVDAEG